MTSWHDFAKGARGEKKDKKIPKLLRPPKVKLEGRDN
jgi:hypothetical protein